MVITAIEITETTAILELRPNWLARLFGARTTMVELSASCSGEHRRWYVASTGRLLERASYDDDPLLRALEFRTIQRHGLPTAVAREAKLRVVRR